MLEQPKQIQSEKVTTKTKVRDSERFVQLNNKLLQFGISHLSSIAIKMLYLVIARYMNAENGEVYPLEIDIPIADFRLITAGMNEKTYQRISKELTAGFKVPNGIIVKGKSYQGEISWFKSITSVGDKMRFQFNPQVLELIKNPQSYTTLYRPEVNYLKSSYAVKIFQVLRGIQNRQKDWHVETRRKFTLQKLRSILGISFSKTLNKEILEAVIKEINKSTNLRVLDIIQHPELGEAESFEFVFKVKPFKNPPDDANSGGNGSKSKNEQSNESDEKIETLLKMLSWAQRLALDALVSFGVKKSIALSKILSRISTGEIIGYEDLFLKELFTYFKENSPRNDADTFTKWWLYSDTFNESGEVWKNSLENLARFKTYLELVEPAVFEEREKENQAALVLKKKDSISQKKNYPIQKPMIS